MHMMQNHQHLDSTDWTTDMIVNNMACGTCLDHVFNHWMVCFRKSAMINLHPDYCDRSRQCWFIAMQPIKYLIIPPTYRGPIFEFNGLCKPQMRPFILKDPALPTKNRNVSMITYGKTYFQ